MRNTFGQVGLKTRSKQQQRKLTCGQILRVATLNVRGVNKAGKREEVEKWMQKHRLYILALQDGHVKLDAKESRQHFAWYFSDEKLSTSGIKFAGGVGFVIKN